MEILTPGYDLDDFFLTVSESAASALMLDYDGTLAPFRAERDSAFPYPGVAEVLARLSASPRIRTVIISGRPVRDVARLISIDLLPEIWGSHGLERQAGDGGYRVSALSPATRKGFQKAEQWIAKEGLDDVTERKPSGFAFHWRGLPVYRAQNLQKKIREKWLSTAADFDLFLHDFDGGSELRPVGITKGNAVESIIREMGAAAPLAYLGDDLTDEDAFKALRGRGLRILVRPERRQTTADLWVKPPGELLDLLTRWLQAGG